MNIKTLTKLLISVIAFSLSINNLSAESMKEGGTRGPSQWGKWQPKPKAPIFKKFDEYISEDLKAQREEIKTQREQLVAERKAEIEALGDDATREEIKAVWEQFREDNSEVLTSLKAQAKELREAVKDYLVENEIIIPKPERPEISKEEIKDHIAGIKKKKKDRKEAWLAAINEAKANLGEDATKSEIREEAKNIIIAAKEAAEEAAEEATEAAEEATEEAEEARL